jgi:hypothetical protein
VAEPNALTSWDWSLAGPTLGTQILSFTFLIFFCRPKEHKVRTT